MISARPCFTREDYDSLPEGFPCELIEGELVKEPAPFYRHQRVVVGLVELIAKAIGRDRVVCSPIDVALDDLSVLQPDVALFAAPLDADLRRVPLPTLVIEVLSDSTAARDRERKTGLYLAHGVAEVWLVHPFEGTVEVSTSTRSTKHGPDELVTSSAVPEITVRGRDLIR